MFGSSLQLCRDHCFPAPESQGLIQETRCPLLQSGIQPRDICKRIARFNAPCLVSKSTPIAKVQISCLGAMGRCRVMQSKENWAPLDSVPTGGFSIKPLSCLTILDYDSSANRGDILEGSPSSLCGRLGLCPLRPRWRGGALERRSKGLQCPAYC